PSEIALSRAVHASRVLAGSDLGGDAGGAAALGMPESPQPARSTATMAVGTSMRAARRRIGLLAVIGASIRMGPHRGVRSTGAELYAGGALPAACASPGV